MRAQRAYGRPGTAVVPPSWAESHSPVAAGFLGNSVVNLRRPGGAAGEFDPDLGRTVTEPYDPFVSDLPVRIHPVGRDQSSGPATETAGDDVKVTGYVVSVPLDTLDVQLKEGALVDVTASEDPLLVGRTLRVNDVVRGDLRFLRDLVCTIND